MAAARRHGARRACVFARRTSRHALRKTTTRGTKRARCAAQHHARGGWFSRHRAFARTAATRISLRACSATARTPRHIHAYRATTADAWSAPAWMTTHKHNRAALTHCHSCVVLDANCTSAVHPSYDGFDCRSRVYSHTHPLTTRPRIATATQQCELLL